MLGLAVLHVLAGIVGISGCRGHLSAKASRHALAGKVSSYDLTMAVSAVYWCAETPKQQCGRRRSDSIWWQLHG
jgi:hypothetical protein